MKRADRLIPPQEKTQSRVKGQENPSQTSGDRLHCVGVRASGDQSHKVQQSDGPSQEKSRPGIGDRLHFAGSTRNPEGEEPEASRLGRPLLYARKRAAECVVVFWTQQVPICDSFAVGSFCVGLLVLCLCLCRLRLSFVLVLLCCIGLFCGRNG